jgi:hypothetical protein
MANSPNINGSTQNGITTQPLPASQKVYVHNHRNPALGVAMRAVTLSSGVEHVDQNAAGAFTASAAGVLHFAVDEIFANGFE